jgi:hypothetical protein
VLGLELAFHPMGVLTEPGFVGYEWLWESVRSDDGEGWMTVHLGRDELVALPLIYVAENLERPCWCDSDSSDDTKAHQCCGQRVGRVNR